MQGRLFKSTQKKKNNWGGNVCSFKMSVKRNKVDGRNFFHELFLKDQTGLRDVSNCHHPKKELLQQST